jgi:hypothetical protein
MIFVVLALQAATNANTINRKLILFFFHHYSVFMKLPLSTRYCAFSAILSLVSIPETTCTKPQFRSGFD